MSRSCLNIRYLTVAVCDAGLDTQIAKLMVDRFIAQGIHIPDTVLTSVEIRKADGRFIVMRRHADGKVYDAEIYDQVFNCWGRKSRSGGLKLENMPGVKVSSDASQAIEGGNHGILEMTGNERVFAVGDVLKGAVNNYPAATITGLKTARIIKDLIYVEDLRNAKDTPSQPFAKEVIYRKYGQPTQSFKLLTIKCIPGVSVVGLTENQAISQYGKNQVTSILFKIRPLLEDFADNDLDMHHYKIVAIRDTGKIVGLHYIGENGADIMHGLLIAVSQGLTVQMLRDSFFIHPSRSEGFWKAAMLMDL